jgi:uncharacterized protein (DUF58 family)
MADFLPFILFLFLLAVFLRAESALTVFYMIIGTFALGFWWNLRALRHIKVSRDFEDHAFLGEEISVRLKIINLSILPILWLEIHESLPVNLRAGRNVKQVFSLGIHGEKEINYNLSALKRGYYFLGPLLASSGDPLGLIKPAQNEFPKSQLTIYPQIVDLESLGLPSRSPFGTLKHHNPIFEDPSRLLGKRDFQYGDSIRRIDWKSSAASGQLQVKLYEASIALEVAILLDLHRDSYDIKTFFDATELAVIAAASIAAWGKIHQQTIGLVTNGVDPQQGDEIPHPLLPKKGTGHFINILEILARIQPGQKRPIETLVQDSLGHLSWGATMVLVSGGLQEGTLTQLYQARKRGVNPVIIFTGHSHNFTAFRKLADHYHISLYKAAYPHNLKTMRPE